MTRTDNVARVWEAPPEGRLIGRGHPAGDFLEDQVPMG